MTAGPEQDKPHNWSSHRTERLLLDRVVDGDLDDLHVIHADPRVWTHFPSGCHSSTDQTEELIKSAMHGWEAANLGYWSVREVTDGPVIGIGGCRLLADHDRWNLYYRFSPDVQGRGYATELARAAVAAGNDVAPGRPVVAYMLATNPGSWRVADKIGLVRVWEGPDEGNPDPGAIRFVYTDQPDIDI